MSKKRIFQTQNGTIEKLVASPPGHVDLFAFKNSTLVDLLDQEFPGFAPPVGDAVNEDHNVTDEHERGEIRRGERKKLARRCLTDEGTKRHDQEERSYSSRHYGTFPKGLP